MSHRYPLDPLVALTGWTLTDVRRLAPCNGTEWRTRQEAGVTSYIADRIACAAGYHPHEVWPEMARHEFEELSRECEECGELFLPSHKARKDVRFCSKRCGRRFSYRKRYYEATGERERARKRREYAECADYYRAAARRRYRLKREAA